MPETGALAWPCAAVAGSQDMAGEKWPQTGSGRGERSGAVVGQGAEAVRVAVRSVADHGKQAGGREHTGASPFRCVRGVP